jgi:hypothetical protein
MKQKLDFIFDFQRPTFAQNCINYAVFPRYIILIFCFSIQ